MTASQTTTPVELTTAPLTESVSLTETAAIKVRALLDQEGRDDLRLRVAVQPGGCSGLQYQLFFDERVLDGDVDIDSHGVPIVVGRFIFRTSPGSVLAVSGHRSVA